MFTVSYFVGKGIDPDIYLYHYYDGRVRLHRRGPNHRIDKWYSSFEDVVPVVEHIVSSGRWINFKECDGDRPMTHDEVLDSITCPF